MILFLLFFLHQPSFAGTLDEHKKEMQIISMQAGAYDKRLGELQQLKMTTPEGPQLEEVLSEITDIHKELLSLRQRRETLKTHLRKEHSKDDLYSDLSFYKQEVPIGINHEKNAKDDAMIDEKLDLLLKKVQSQYVRSLSEDFKLTNELQAEFDVRKKLKDQRAKTLKADKEKYIREAIPTTIKVD